MLEIGLAIIAACLPVLGPLISDKSREHMTDTARGIFSFASHRSGRTSKSYNIISDGKVAVANNQNKRSVGVESFAMGGMEQPPATLDAAHIVVTSSTSQQSSKVV